MFGDAPYASSPYGEQSVVVSSKQGAVRIFDQELYSITLEDSRIYLAKVKDAVAL
jgi:hypothetical protein